MGRGIAREGNATSVEGGRRDITVEGFYISEEALGQCGISGSRGGGISSSRGFYISEKTFGEGRVRGITDEDTGVSRPERHLHAGRAGCRQHSPPYLQVYGGKCMRVGRSDESCMRSLRDRQCGLGCVGMAMLRIYLRRVGDDNVLPDQPLHGLLPRSAGAHATEKQDAYPLMAPSSEREGKGFGCCVVMETSS